MTATLYVLCAAVAAVLGTRAWVLDRDDPGRRAFMGLGWSLALGWVALGLGFLPGGDWVRLPYVVFGILGPAFAWVTVDALFPPDRRPVQAAALLAGATLVGAVGAGAHVAFFMDWLRPSPAEIVVGTCAYALAGLTVHRLTEARATSTIEAERTRLRWLTGIVGASVVLALAEWIARTLRSTAGEADLPFFERGLALQGVLPPTSPLLGVVALYVLYHALQNQRIVTLRELARQALVVAALAAALVGLHLVTLAFVSWVRFPLHASILLFLVSAVFLGTESSLRKPLSKRIAAWLDLRAHQLDEALRSLSRSLPTATSPRSVATLLAKTLHASGRFAAVRVWLADPLADVAVLAADEGGEGPGVIHRVASPPLMEALDGGRPLLARTDAVRDASSQARRDRLEAMGVDLLAPLRSGDLVVGWVGLRDEAWSDGLTGEERRALLDAAELAGAVLANLEEVRRMAEARRLAALGEMSAGLAHEIRNPLAGLKGAAQVLQSIDLDEEDREMCQVIVDEADRLDHVVSQFLDFARPFQLHVETRSLADPVRHAMHLVRAQGLPAGVSLGVDVPDDLPPVPHDKARVTQLVLNLVRNAVQALGEDGGHVHVALVAARDGEVHLRVEDDGPGLPSPVRAQLFTPFVTTRPGGTGLGLAISERITRAHGGRLTATDRHPGTAFVASFPAAVREGVEEA